MIGYAPPRNADGSGARRDTNALAQVRKVQHRAQYLAVERWTNIRVRRVTNPEHATDIQELYRVTGIQACRQVP